LPGPKQKPYPEAVLPKTQMPCQEEKLKKERPETDTSAHAWPYDRTGIPITYARKNAAPLALDVQAVALSADKPPIALIHSMQILSTVRRPDRTG